MKRFIRKYLEIFILIASAGYFLVSLSKSQDILFGIGITSLIFIVYFLIRATICFVREENKIGILNLIISLLLLIIILKINYYYYNVIFGISAILIASLYLKKIRNSTKSIFKSICSLLIVLNIFSLLTPDNVLFEYGLYNNKSWSPNLTWDSFKGEPEKDSKFTAAIFTEFKGKINRVYNYPPAYMIAVVNENKSWKRLHNDSVSASNLLKHEQGHFDITEIYKRKAIDSIKNSWGRRPEQIQKIITHFYEQKELYHSLYDLTTNHGQNELEQKEWNSKIYIELNK
jgi:hypothetical protein